MSLFSKQKSKQKVRPLPNAEPPYHPIWSNFGFLFTTNFKLIPFFLPSMVSMGLFLVSGGALFFYAALLLLLPAGPAVCAMFDVSYQLCRELPQYEHKTFFRSYRANFRQGVATMAVMLPVIVLLTLLLLAQNKPIWVMVCLILGSVILMAFAVLAFSQVALVPLPLRKIWKNALLLIPLTHWRCLLIAVVYLLFLAVLYQWMEVTFLMFLFLGPALLNTWSANLLWPVLEDMLVEQEG